jgi:hypothetical protein
MVVLRSLCPHNSWTERISAPCASKYVTREWRNVWQLAAHSGPASRCTLLCNRLSRPAWPELLSADGQGLRPVTQPQARPARRPFCGGCAAGRAHSPTRRELGGVEWRGDSGVRGRWRGRHGKSGFLYLILMRLKSPAIASEGGNSHDPTDD